MILTLLIIQILSSMASVKVTFKYYLFFKSILIKTKLILLDI